MNINSLPQTQTAIFYTDVFSDTDFGELIPKAEIIIFDEVHQIPDIASHYFGQQLTS